MAGWMSGRSQQICKKHGMAGWRLKECANKSKNTLSLAGANKNTKTGCGWLDLEEIHKTQSKIIKKITPWLAGAKNYAKMTNGWLGPEKICKQCMHMRAYAIAGSCNFSDGDRCAAFSAECCNTRSLNLLLIRSISRISRTFL